MNFERVDHFLNEVTRWAATQPDMLALALVGSYARGAATETSDIDLVLISTQPDRYLNTQDWLNQFGTIEKKEVEDYSLVTSIRAWYSGGFEVEYGLTDQRWIADPLDEGTRQVISDGLRVLFERGAILSRHL
jgi:predicted nucleotidyltransferase